MRPYSQPAPLLRPLVYLLGLSSVATAYVLPANDVQLGSSISARATFVVPCTDCGVTSAGLPSNESFTFDFQTFTAETACGSSNLTLNGIPLTGLQPQHGVHLQGQASIPASGHHLAIRWDLDCLVDFLDNSIAPISSDDAQLLTLIIDQVDSRNITFNPAGFTVSFNQLSNPPELLRLSLRPEFTAKEPEYSSTWREPPEDLRYNSAAQPSQPSSDESTLKAQIDDLRRLEAEAERLSRLIDARKESIKSSVRGELNSLKSAIDQCDDFVCVLKAVLDKAHGAAKLLYWKFRPNPYRGQTPLGQNSYKAPAAGNQHLNNMDAAEITQTRSSRPLPTRDLHSPPQAHCSDGRPGEKLPQWNEKGNHDISAPLPSAYQEARDPSALVAFLEALLVLTGIAALWSFIRRRCCSLRTQAERAARREQREAERAYRRSARRQALSDWWHGRGRISRRGRHPADLDEKRHLVQAQEGVLEANMQDEIRQLQIAEEIRRLRHTHNTVDELVRAEEGRSRHRYSRPYSQVRDAGPAFVPGPVSITIPQPSSTTYPSTDSTPPSPLSRTSSLPDYRSEDEISHPPSYHTDDDTLHDTFSDYDASSETAPSVAYRPGAWTPASSIPDISPRPSIETTRAFL